jgi:tRNA threonylcarbamoyl adenosine modification protein YeaZ
VLVLVVDTSTAAVTAALVNIEPSHAELLAVHRTVDARAHGEQLAPAVRAVLGSRRARELTAIVAGTGPGPFTGLRVGLVTAASMGQALAVPVYGVCSLDGIGAEAPGTVLVATDARRKEVYWAGYEQGMRRTDPAVDRPADVPARLAEHGLVVSRAAGEGARLYADVLGLPVLDEPRYPSPLALAELAADRVRAAAPGEALQPLYLRRPDAVLPGAPKLVRQ